MARRRVTQAVTVERKIFFYRVHVADQRGARPIAFDPAPVLAHISSLPFTLAGRYWEGPDGKLACCWPEEGGPPHKLRLGTIRRTDLPLIERGGTLSPLPIPADSGLAEQTHVVFFEENLVGADFNFHGPRATSLAWYFAEKARGVCPPLQMEVLLRQDVGAQLRRLRDIRLFQLKVSSSFIDVLREANRDLGAAFAAASKAGEADEVEIVLKPRRYSRGWLSDALKPLAFALSRNRRLRDEASRFLVSGFDPQIGETITLDVLSDKLIGQRRILRVEGRSRAVEATSAFDGIQDTFAELRDQLLEAAGIRG